MEKTSRIAYEEEKQVSMAKVIESIEREAFERTTQPEDEMTLVEYAEKVSPIPLTEWQKKFFDAYEQAEKENKEFAICFPPRAGRAMALQTVNEWKKLQALKEHRCPCGRLLGKFAGQAEVKCPKCGKVNVIGGERNGIDR